MTLYELLRVILAFIHIIATLAVPFIIMRLEKKYKFTAPTGGKGEE